MKNFRIDIGQHGDTLAKSIDQFENEALKNVASKLIIKRDVGGWAKFHASGTWAKGKPTTQTLEPDDDEKKKKKEKEEKDDDGN